MVYTLVSEGRSFGDFKTREEAEQFAQARLEALKIFAGEYYFPYEIIEIMRFRLCLIG